MPLRQPSTPLCFLLHSFIAPSACVWFTSTLILACERVCCVQMLQDWTAVCFSRTAISCFWLRIYNPSDDIICPNYWMNPPLCRIVCVMVSKCVFVCVQFVVLHWLLRFSNGFHSPTFFSSCHTCSSSFTSFSPSSSSSSSSSLAPAHCCCLGLKPPKKRLDYNPGISTHQRTEVISHSTVLEYWY